MNILDMYIKIAEYSTDIVSALVITAIIVYYVIAMSAIGGIP